MRCPVSVPQNSSPRREFFHTADGLFFFRLSVQKFFEGPRVLCEHGTADHFIQYDAIFVDEIGRRIMLVRKQGFPTLEGNDVEVADTGFFQNCPPLGHGLFVLGVKAEADDLATLFQVAHMLIMVIL